MTDLSDLELGDELLTYLYFFPFGLVLLCMPKRFSSLEAM
jgi:hypothetical protein